MRATFKALINGGLQINEQEEGNLIRLVLTHPSLGSPLLTTQFYYKDAYYDILAYAMYNSFITAIQGLRLDTIDEVEVKDALSLSGLDPLRLISNYFETAIGIYEHKLELFNETYDYCIESLERSISSFLADTQ